MTDEKDEGEPMELREAVTTLDPNDDAHWTQDGKPDLNVVKERIGKKVTRKDVDAILPDFTRQGAIDAAAPQTTRQLPENPSGNPAVDLADVDDRLMDEGDPVLHLERFASCCTPSVLQANPELQAMAQHYRVSREAIMNHRKRTIARGRVYSASADVVREAAAAEMEARADPKGDTEPGDA